MIIIDEIIEILDNGSETTYTWYGEDKKTSTTDAKDLEQFYN